MNYVTGTFWKMGEKRKNPDSITLQSVNTKQGCILMACICHGTGENSHGELASGFVAEEVTRWFYEQAVVLWQKRKFSVHLRASFFRCMESVEKQMRQFSGERGIILGSTISCLVLSPTHYHLFQAGAGNIYKFGGKCRKLTKEISETNREGIGNGILKTPRCQYGRYKKREGFLLCGCEFSRFFDERQLFRTFKPDLMEAENTIDRTLLEIGKRNEKRRENQNKKQEAKPQGAAIYIRQRRKWE